MFISCIAHASNYVLQWIPIQSVVADIGDNGQPASPSPQMSPV
jgi:hypothetical protein